MNYKISLLLVAICASIGLSTADSTTDAPTTVPTTSPPVDDFTTPSAASPSTTVPSGDATTSGASGTTSSSSDVTTTIGGSPGTTASAGSTVSQTPGPSNTPNTNPTGGSTGTSFTTIGTTPAPTTEAIEFSTVKLDNSLDVLDAKKTLQNALILRNQIIKLSQQLTDMQQDMDVNQSPQIKELYTLQDQSQALMNNLTSLQASLKITIARENQLLANYSSAQTDLSCLVASNCVTDIPTTVTTTTPLPTTTHPLVTCPDTPAKATATNQTFVLPTTSYISCDTKLNGGSQNLVLVVDVTITGAGSLSILDGLTGTVLESYNSTTTGNVPSVTTSLVVLRYSSIGDSNKIAFNIAYRGADPCEENPDLCGENGTCQLTTDGKPYCLCNKCYSGDKCDVETNPCSSTAQRKCKSGTCKKDESADQCAYYCDCGTTPPPGPKPTSCASSTIFDEIPLSSRWLF